MQIKVDKDHSNTILQQLAPHGTFQHVEMGVSHSIKEATQSIENCSQGKTSLRTCALVSREEGGVLTVTHPSLQHTILSCHNFNKNQALDFKFGIKL